MRLLGELRKPRRVNYRLRIFRISLTPISTLRAIFAYDLHLNGEFQSVYKAFKRYTLISRGSITSLKDNEYRGSVHTLTHCIINCNYIILRSYSFPGNSIRS